MNPIDRIEQLRADLARATAELEHHKSVKETIDSAHKELSREHAALRARFAELEQYRAGDAVALAQPRIRVEHADSEVTAQTKQRIDAENRVAELVAALRDAVGMLEELDGLDWGEEGMPFDVDFNHFAKVLSPVPFGVAVGRDPAAEELAEADEVDHARVASTGAMGHDDNPTSPLEHGRHPFSGRYIEGDEDVAS